LRIRSARVRLKEYLIWQGASPSCILFSEARLPLSAYRATFPGRIASNLPALRFQIMRGVSSSAITANSMQQAWQKKTCYMIGGGPDARPLN